jgi:hypothetical protein
MKCFMHAAARGGDPPSIGSACIPSMIAAPILAARYGSSPKVSQKRAHSGFSAIPNTGENNHGIAAARVSLAVISPQLRANSVLNVAAVASC